MRMYTLIIYMCIYIYISTLPNPPCVKELAFGPGPSVRKNRQEQQGSSLKQARKGLRTESTLAEITVVLVHCCYST